MKRTIFFLLSLFVPGMVALASEPMAVGDAVPEFELSDQSGQLHSLEDYRDQWVVLYFYPKDQTPGCTTEACEFRDNIFEFKRLNAQILGVSLDDVESHKLFAEEYNLPFPLLADIEGKVSESYGVKTRMFGMKLAKRQTFLIHPDGTLAKHYVKVDVNEHSAEVLADLRAMGAGEN